MPSDGYDGMFLTEKLVTTWVSEDIAGGCELQSRALETPVASPYDYLYNGSGQLGALSSLRPSLFHVGVHPSPPLPSPMFAPPLCFYIKLFEQFNAGDLLWVGETFARLKTNPDLH